MASIKRGKAPDCFLKAVISRAPRTPGAVPGLRKQYQLFAELNVVVGDGDRIVVLEGIVKRLQIHVVLAG